MTENESEQKRYIQKKRQYFFTFLIVMAVISLGWYFSSSIIDCIIPDETKRGVFGDKFGAINALFSGLAFAGVIYTILLQSLELEQQRKEIKDTTEQLRQQKEIFDRQNFEDKFFKILSSIREISINAEFYVIVNNYHSPFNGIEAFEKLMIYNISPHNNNEPIRSIILKFEGQFHTKYNYFNRYFKEVEFLVKYIDQQNLSKQLKKFYVDYYKIFFYEIEIVFIALYGVSKYGRSFKPLIEKYELLSDLYIYLASTNGRGEQSWSISPALLKEYEHLKTKFEEKKSSIK